MKTITYPERLTLQPLLSPIDHTVTVPGSKSITNRALILAALAEGESTLKGVLTSEDTHVMQDSLQRLGFQVTIEEEGETVRVCGEGGRIPAHTADLFIGNSGTSVRFLTALVALGKGTYRLDGVPRMRERPQAALLDALADLRVSARSEIGNGCPPLIVEAEGGLQGGRVTIDASASSQFLSALLMVAPYAQYDTTLEIRGSLRPFYVDITRRMMMQWGVATRATNNAQFRISSGQRYDAQTPYCIEPDASSASYFFALAAITGGRVTIPNLSHEALQGDVRFATEVLAEMGCTVTASENAITVQGPKKGELKGIERDMSAISDTSLTLAAIAPFANSPTTVTNIAHSRLQECDRIAAVCTELRRLGVEVEEFADGFRIQPTTTFQTPTTIQTYNDHRVAMSFALIGQCVSGITIENPACVAKTFPNYWQKLEEIRE
jgi:3-phosphoshikimate 1-carboxyvinyltransferase